MLVFSLQHKLLEDAEQSLTFLFLGIVRVTKSSGQLDGSSTSWAKMTARAAAEGAASFHQEVEGAWVPMPGDGFLFSRTRMPC